MYDTKTHATEHFAWSEWDPQGIATPDQRAAFHRHANNVLEPLRKFLGRPVTITLEGGVRSHAEQKAIWDKAVREAGGDESVAALHVAHPGSSRHEVGDATDIPEARLSERKRIIAYLLTNPAVGGIGEYPWGIHVDSRPRFGGVIARW